MTLNGLGFIERRLYLFPEFFDDIALSRLIGPGITREHLNDDVFGRTLDAMAEYGPTELFNEIVAKCLLDSDSGTYCVHIHAEINKEKENPRERYDQPGEIDLREDILVLDHAQGRMGEPLCKKSP